jgi:hypothetical protein
MIKLYRMCNFCQGLSIAKKSNTEYIPLRRMENGNYYAILEGREYTKASLGGVEKTCSYYQAYRHLDRFGLIISKRNGGRHVA